MRKRHPAGALAGLAVIAVIFTGLAAPAAAQDPNPSSSTKNHSVKAKKKQKKAHKPAAAVRKRVEAAGTPGVPQPPTTVFAEDFENISGPPVRLTSYTGASGTTYTADPGWLTGCNGWVLNNADSAGFAPGATDCGGQGIFDSLRTLPSTLGQFAGSATPNANHAIAAFTSNSPGANQVELQTNSPITLPAPGRFITFEVDSAALNCSVSGPQLQFYLMDGATANPTFTSPINPCTDPNASTIGAAKVVRAPGNKPILFGGTAVGIRLTNANGDGNGNDAAFDNIKILDVTPQIDKAFSPTLASSIEFSTLTFTITNTNDLLAKPGWSFTDNLPAGMTVADPAGTSTTCTNGSVTAAPGDTSVQLAGDLNAGQASCTLSVNVVAPKGTYQNCDTNVADAVGVNPPGCAQVEFDDPKYSVAKSSDPVPGSTILPGETVTYKLTITNDGRVPVTPTIEDDLTGVLDDAQYNDDATAGTGQPNYAEPILTWTGTLAVGASTEVTYTVTVDKPIGGDFSMLNTVTTQTVGGNCMPDGEPCVHDVPLPKYVVMKKSDPASGEVVNGDKVTYTITVENTGKLEYSPTFTDTISGILDDATYNGDAKADIGTVTYSAPKLDWSGTLPVGGKATITYSVTVTAQGDGALDNVVRGTAPSGNCPIDEPSSDPEPQIEAALLEPDITDPDCRTHLVAVYVPDTGQPTGRIALAGMASLLAGAGLLVWLRRRSVA